MKPRSYSSSLEYNEDDRLMNILGKVKVLSTDAGSRCSETGNLEKTSFNTSFSLLFTVSKLTLGKQDIRHGSYDRIVTCFCDMTQSVVMFVVLCSRSTQHITPALWRVMC